MLDILGQRRTGDSEGDLMYLSPTATEFRAFRSIGGLISLRSCQIHECDETLQARVGLCAIHSDEDMTSAPTCAQDAHRAASRSDPSSSRNNRTMLESHNNARLQYRMYCGVSKKQYFQDHFPMTPELAEVRVGQKTVGSAVLCRLPRLRRSCEALHIFAASQSTRPGRRRAYA
jgi:hypothetical protein